MDDEQNYLISLKFMRVTGFYQLIDPQTPKRYGVNLYKVCAAMEIGTSVVLMPLLFSSSYFYRRDTNELMSHFMLVLAIFFSTVKFSYVWKNARLVWDCLEMTSVGFLSSGLHDKRTLRGSRPRSVSTSSVFIVLWSFVVIAWSLSPFFFRDVYMAAEYNGRVRRLRYNSLNIVYPVTERFFNDNFAAFYLIEMVQVIIWGHATIAYDSFVVSVCIAIYAQLGTIAQSYSRLCTAPKPAQGESEFSARLFPVFNRHYHSVQICQLSMLSF